MSLLMIICLMASVVFLMLAIIRQDSDVDKSIRERLVTELATITPIKRSPLSKVIHGLSLAVPKPLAAWSERRYANALTSGWVGYSPAEFVMLKLLVTLLCVIGVLAVLGAKGLQAPLLLVAVAVGFVGPDLWLHQCVRRRQFLIARDLPDVVDLLTLCVEAGIDFMGAMNRIVREFRKSPLVDELAVMLREVKLGKRRRDALKAMSKRVNVQDLHSFVRTMVQVDRMGTGIAEALRIQSEESRLRRQHVGERIAQKAPLKMMIPLILCIMPSVLILVGGPVLLQFIRGDLFPKEVMNAGPLGGGAGAPPPPAVDNAPPLPLRATSR